jgi:hypothetical protein
MRRFDFMPAHARRILILLALSICAYIPALRLPFISDDFAQIPLARQYASQGWTPLLDNADLRARTTYMFLSAALDRAFGFTPQPFYAASLLLHALCVLLVYATAVWTELSPLATFWAACFFAIYEGHQEAVMWVAASSDLFVFLFGMAAWICWVKWLQQAGVRWYLVAVAAFVLALASKESAWIFPMLMLIPVLTNHQHLRRALYGILPFFALAVAYVAWSWFTRVAQPGYNDIRFSLTWLWPLVIVRSFWRLVFIWGLLAAAALLWIGEQRDRRKIWTASLWMILGILPYSFLTYMPQIPSRHTYLASAGLSFLVGAAAVRLLERTRRGLLVTLSAIVLIANLEIIWVKKMAQYRERAEPSELLRQAVRAASGPVLIECTPLSSLISRSVLEDAGGQAVFSPQARVDEHCFDIRYQATTGDLVHVNRRLGTQKHGAFY